MRAACVGVYQYVVTPAVWPHVAMLHHMAAPHTVIHHTAPLSRLASRPHVCIPVVLAAYSIGASHVYHLATSCTICTGPVNIRTHAEITCSHGGVVHACRRCAVVATTHRGDTQRRQRCQALHGRDLWFARGSGRCSSQPMQGGGGVLSLEPPALLTWGQASPLLVPCAGCECPTPATPDTRWHPLR